VADVNTLGGMVQLRGGARHGRLAARRVSLQQLQEALAANNRNDGAGRLASGEESLLVRSDGSIPAWTTCAPSPSPAGAAWPCAWATWPGAPGRAHALRRVTRTARARPCRGWCWACAAPMRASWCRTCARLHEIEANLPAGIRSCPSTTAAAWSSAPGTVSKALAEAIVLVLVLLLLFLGNLRAALVVALMLPLSALATFVLMRSGGCRPT
jgi:cobalt-zinc-cadmium resistance protein CzcA